MNVNRGSNRMTPEEGRHDQSQGFRGTVDEQTAMAFVTYLVNA